MPQISNVVRIVHINKAYSSLQKVEPGGSYITLTDSTFSIVANQTSTSVILKGFVVKTTTAHSIRLLVTYDLQNTNLKIYVKG